MVRSWFTGPWFAKRHVPSPNRLTRPGPDSSVRWLDPPRLRSSPRRSAMRRVPWRRPSRANRAHRALSPSIPSHAGARCAHLATMKGPCRARVQTRIRALTSMGVTSLLLAVRYTRPEDACSSRPQVAFGGGRVRHCRGRLWVFGQVEQLRLEWRAGGAQVLRLHARQWHAELPRPK